MTIRGQRLIALWGRFRKPAASCAMAGFLLMVKPAQAQQEDEQL
jgi:hypothetical protein